MKKSIRALLLLVLTFALAFVFASCANKDNGDNNGTDGENGGNTQASVTYTLTVVDTDGAPVKGVKVEFTAAAASPYPATTNVEGKAAFTSKKSVTAKVTSVPTGYTCEDLNKAIGFDSDGNATVTVVAPAPFVIKVVDQDGNPIKNVKVQMCDDASTCKPPRLTDENGVVTYPYEAKTYHAQLTISESENVSDLYPGYTVDDPSATYDFVGREATIVLTKIGE